MKTFAQSLTRSTNNATQQILSVIYAALSFTREGTFQGTTGGFLFPAIMLPQGVVLTREVTTK